MSSIELSTSLLGSLIAAFTLRCIIVYTYRVFIHPLHSYPGPFVTKLTDWYGTFYATRRQLHFATYSDHQKYGRVIRQGPNKLVFNSSKALHDIYQNDHAFKARSYLVTQRIPNVYNPFNVIDKRLHRARRRIISQGVNDRAVRQFEPIIHEQIAIFLKLLPRTFEDQTTVDMSERCHWLGLDISGELGFGHSFELQTSTKNRWLAKGVSTANYRLNTYMQFPELKYTSWEKLLLPFVCPKVLRFHRMVRGMIEARLAQDKHSRPDLLSSIADYKDPETGTKLSADELWSESTFLIPAGGDTTSTLLAAIFFYLSRYPTVYQRLAQEIRSTFTDVDDIRGGPNLSKCTYLRACLEETLRMNPPVQATLWREFATGAGTEHAVIDGHMIPPGTKVGVNIDTIHHNEAYFPEPFVFRPERWLHEENGLSADEMKTMQDAFTPWSIGQRACPGKAIAYLEASLVLAKTLWYFDFEHTDDEVCSALGHDSPVFHTEDQLGSWHTGPRLKFLPRSDAWKELFADENQ